jgi:DNA-binding beta-propeller fold protein YncE
VAFDPATKSAWVVNGPWSSTSALRRIDLATGAQLQSIALTTKEFGSTQITIGGLQITDEAFTLNGANIPVGSLLVFSGEAYPQDRVIAVNPADGTVLGSLTLKGNYDTTAGLYDAQSNSLFLLDRSQNPRKVLEINPADGTVLSSFNAPLWGDEAGLAVDPVTGNLWMGSYNDGSTLVEMTRTGTEVRRINLASQGIDNNEISGLAFDDAGMLLVSSTQGRVYRVTV